VKLISGFAKQLLITANSEFVPKLFENETMTIIKKARKAPYSAKIRCTIKNTNWLS